MDSDDGSHRSGSRTGGLVTFGYTMGGAFVLFGLLGTWLDKKYATGSNFTLAGLALAFIFSMYELWKVVRWLNSQDQESTKRPPSPNSPPKDPEEPNEP